MVILYTCMFLADRSVGTSLHSYFKIIFVNVVGALCFMGMATSKNVMGNGKNECIIGYHNILHK